MQISARNRSERGKSLVGFLVGGVQYAADIFRVREIINPSQVVTIPHAPTAVMGVADHRGEVVPVLDLRRRFDLPAATKTARSKWLILQTSTGAVALIVDSVTGVFGTQQPEQRQVPTLGVGDQLRGLAAVYSHGGQLVFVIDVDVVAAPAEEMDMNAAHALVAQQEGSDAKP